MPPPPVVSTHTHAAPCAALTQTSQARSPHRFLDGANRRKASPEKPAATARPPSYLARSARRHEEQRCVDAVEPSAQTPQQSFAPPAASQFAPTPRFSATRARPAQAVAPSSPPKASFAQALRAARPREDVEDDGEREGGDDVDEMLLDAEEGEALPTTEHDGVGLQTHQTTELPYSPKRRRTDHDDFEAPAAEEARQLQTGATPTRPTFKAPPDPSTLRSSRAAAVAAPRLAPPSTPSSRAQTPVTDAFHNRPKFLRPSPAQQGTSTEPLPEAFSPHRRGAKFVPGGMAATVQQWVVETGQTAVQSRRGQGYLKGEDLVLKVEVEEVSGEGPWLVQGRCGNGQDASLLLAGGGTGRDVEVGVIVGVRTPTWEVDLGGRRWQVAVNWRLV